MGPSEGASGTSVAERCEPVELAVSCRPLTRHRGFCQLSLWGCCRYSSPTLLVIPPLAPGVDGAVLFLALPCPELVACSPPSPTHKEEVAWGSQGEKLGALA